MTNEDMNKSKRILDDLETRIASAHCGLRYIQLLKLSLVMVNEIRKEIPTYSGLYNPKIEIYDFAIELAKSRLNIED